MVTEQKTKGSKDQLQTGQVYTTELGRSAAEICQDEIEVTPKMMDAGVMEAMGFDAEYDDTTLMVEDVYRAMTRVFLLAESQANLNK